MNIRFLLSVSIIVLAHTASNAFGPVSDAHFDQAISQSPQLAAQNLLNMKGLNLDAYQSERGRLIDELLPTKADAIALPSDIALAERLAARDQFFERMVAERTTAYLVRYAAIVLRSLIDGTATPKKRRKIANVTLPEYGGPVVQAASKLGVVFARGFTDDINVVTAEMRKGLTARIYTYVKWWNHIVTSFDKQYDRYVQKYLSQIIFRLPNDPAISSAANGPTLDAFMVVARLALLTSNFKNSFASLMQAPPLPRDSQEVFDIAALYDALRTQNDQAVSRTIAHMIRDYFLYHNIRSTGYALLLSRFELGNNIAEALKAVQERDLYKLMALIKASEQQAQHIVSERLEGRLASLRAPTMPSLRTGLRRVLPALKQPSQNRLVKAVTRVAHDPAALRKVLIFAAQSSDSSLVQQTLRMSEEKNITQNMLAQELLTRVMAELPPIHEHQKVLPKLKKLGRMNWRRLLIDGDLTKAYNTVVVPLYEQVVCLIEQLLERLPASGPSPKAYAARLTHIKQMVLEQLPAVLQSASRDTPKITPDKKQLLLLVSSAAELLVELKRHVAVAAVFHGVSAAAGR